MTHPGPLGWTRWRRARSPNGPPRSRALVAGWFSFERMGATAGDVMARDVTAGWLAAAGVPYDLAHAAPFTGGVDWEEVDPSRYSHLIFVCGPFYARRKVVELLPQPGLTALRLLDPLMKGRLATFRPSALELLVRRFRQARIIGLDVSMLGSADAWHPFDTLIERDGRGSGRPDLAFAAEHQRVPVAGIVFLDPRPAGQEAVHEGLERAIDEAVASLPLARVRIDTRLDVPNRGHLRNPAEVESLVARMDLVITTRLHGAVLALKNGVPPVMIDSVPGGAKVRAQAETIGWPIVLEAGGLTARSLAEAVDSCLREETRLQARKCGDHARSLVEDVHEEFLRCLSPPDVDQPT